MKIHTRKPALQVTLHKHISRTTLDGATPVSTRFSGASRSVDLTPYIGEHNGIRVNKSVREPAGSFSITLTDDLYYPGTYHTGANYGDSLYGLIEPMDGIEIRITGDAYRQSANGNCSKIPIMMRGFVSRVERSETMGADGRPQRNVILSGQDYGKLLQMIQIFQMPGIPASDASYITAFPMFAQFGVGNSIMPAGEFISTLFGKVVNPYIAAIDTTLHAITPDIIVKSGQVSPYGTGGWAGGTLHSLIMSIGDIGPWNEFFIEDREDGPYAVYRPNPFYAVDNTLLFAFPKGKFPVTTVIDRSDVVSISAVRSDANVANYFWADCPRFNLNYESTLRAVAVQSAQTAPAGSPNPGPYVTNYQNVDPKLYGQRKMVEQTNQGGDAETDNGNGTPAGIPRTDNENVLRNWITQRRIDLIAQNKDSVIFETGTIRLKGHEAIKAGTYVQYQAGNVPAFYYVVAVEHDCAPFGSFFTTVQYERGTGFIGRVQQDVGSSAPYLSEMVDKS